MQKRRGFTIVEMVVTMAIMAILLTLTVVGLSASQINARDAKRKADTEAIARGLEIRYKQGNSQVTAPSYVTPGVYPGINEMQHMQGASEAGYTPAQVVGGYLTQALPGTTSANFTAPSGSSTSFTLICAAACGAAENTTTINAATTTKTYVYEPIDTNGNVCTDGGCVRFNLYYRLEKDNSLQTIRSEHQ